MDEGTRKEADRRFEEALEATGARDPRDFYRKALRELKERDAAGYDRAVSHFQHSLVPSIAAGEVEPLGAWRDYGCLIAEAFEEGRAVAIDESGKSLPFDSETPMDWLVLHVPENKGTRAILVSLPLEPSPAQRATYDLLVRGRHTISAPG